MSFFSNLKKFISLYIIKLNFRMTFLVIYTKFLFIHPGLDTICFLSANTPIWKVFSCHISLYSTI